MDPKFDKQRHPQNKLNVDQILIYKSPCCTIECEREAKPQFSKRKKGTNLVMCATCLNLWLSAIHYEYLMIFFSVKRSDVFFIFFAVFQRQLWHMPNVDSREYIIDISSWLFFAHFHDKTVVAELFAFLWWAKGWIKHHCAYHSLYSNNAESTNTDNKQFNDDFFLSPST